MAKRVKVVNRGLLNSGNTGIALRVRVLQRDMGANPRCPMSQPWDLKRIAFVFFFNYRCFLCEISIIT